MTTPSRDFNDTWTQVVDMLIRGTDVRDGEPQPLTTQHKALLRSVQPVGQVNGFVLLATGSEMVQTLVKEELSDRIERALDVITGRPQQVVVTISEDSSHADTSHADTSQADASYADAPHQDAGRGRGVDQAAGHDSGAWRTIEFERDARDAAQFGDPRGFTGQSPHDPRSPLITQPGQGGQMPGTPGAPYSTQSPHSGQTPQVPHGGGAQTQGTAADLFGQSKYHLHGMENPMSQPVEEPTLNPKYTFETFVIGSSNRFAHAAAVAVACLLYTSPSPRD